MTSFFLLTAFMVSVDSLVCGFSLPKAEKNRLLIVLTISVTVFFMCCIANYSALYLKNVLSEKTTLIGGVVLIAVGIVNLTKKDDTPSLLTGTLKQSLMVGFAVGIDGSAANLSLALMGINAFYVPVIIALMHAVMVLIGISIRQTFSGYRLEKYSFLPPLILTFLGVYKTIFAFL